jgi:hypothetical protein
VSPWNRFLAWLVTGPAGRVLAFFWDLTAALLNAAAGKVRRSRL